MEKVGYLHRYTKQLSSMLVEAHDLNSWLSFAIIVLFVAAGALFAAKGSNLYISGGTLFLLCILCIHSILFLSLNRKYQDPFIILLVSNLILFYLLRVLTLLISEHSSVLTRYPTTSSSLNFSIVFIILSNTAIFLGLILADRKNRPQKLSSYRPLRHPLIIFLPILAVFTYYALYVLPIDIHHRFMQYLSSLVLHRGTVFIIISVFAITFFNRLSPKLKILYGISLLIFLIIVTALGSRGGLLGIVIWVGVSILSIKEKISFKWKVVLLVFPLLILQYYIFSFATFVRGHFPEVRGTSQERIASFMKIPDTINRMSSTRTGNDAKIRTFERIFNRIGFLDISTDLISHKDKYDDVINFQYYFKSIVDNCLTPGMNIYQTPRAAHSLSYIYYGRQNAPTHEDVKKAYQSDMFTIYGEYYILFGGVIALVVMFAGAYAFKWIYLALHHGDIFLLNCYRALLLYIFLLWINSFGIDWLILDLICISITFMFSKSCYALGMVELRTKLVRDNYSPNL